MDQQQQVLTELAVLKAQLSGVVSSIDEVKTSVGQVLVLDRTLAELSVRHEQQQRELATQWKRIDDVEKFQESTNAKADEWINRGRGAWYVAVALGSFVQVLVLAISAWVFSHVRAAEDSLLLINHRVTQLEAASSRKP
jgi:hypothetical protein